MTTDLGSWMAISSVVISLAVLIFGLIQYKQVARKDYVEDLTKRVEACEEEHQDCERERTRLLKLTTELLLDTRRMAEKKIDEQKDIGT